MTPVDYPDLAYVAAKSVSEKQVDRAILICATGLGMSIAANKVRGIRAALCHDELSAHIAATTTTRTSCASPATRSARCSCGRSSRRG